MKNSSMTEQSMFQKMEILGSYGILISGVIELQNNFCFALATFKIRMPFIPLSCINGSQLIIYSVIKTCNLVFSRYLVVLSAIGNTKPSIFVRSKVKLQVVT